MKLDRYRYGTRALQVHACERHAGKENCSYFKSLAPTISFPHAGTVHPSTTCRLAAMEEMSLTCVRPLPHSLPLMYHNTGTVSTRCPRVLHGACIAAIKDWLRSCSVCRESLWLL